MLLPLLRSGYYATSTATRPNVFFFRDRGLPTYMTSINYPGCMEPTATITLRDASPMALHRLAHHGGDLYGSYLRLKTGSITIASCPTRQLRRLSGRGYRHRVPADAELRFDGTLTAETGELRRFITPALIAGKAYRYDISVTWNEDGRPIRRDRQVTFQAGDRLLVDLTRPSPGEERTSTYARSRGRLLARSRRRSREVVYKESDPFERGRCRSGSGKRAFAQDFVPNRNGPLSRAEFLCIRGK